MYRELCSRRIFLFLTRRNNFHITVMTSYIVFIRSVMKQVLGLLGSVVFHNSQKIMWIYLMPTII